MLAQAIPAPGGPGKGFFVDGWADPAFLEHFGITRVGDLTGLDTVGIPVWFACRPNSRGLAVSQGKGLSHAQARISAVMECIEGAVAEQTEPLIACTASLAEMQAEGKATVPLQAMRRCRADRIDPDRARCWVAGFNYFDRAPTHAPYELVGLDMRSGTRWDHQAFLMTTIGLAAGPTVEHAALHALCELIENDATTMIDLLGISGSGAREIDCSESGHAGLGEALAAIDAAGFTVRFFDVTGVIPIPVVACFLEAPFHGGRRPAVGISAGFACRPSAGDAALAALLEAVQSRLTKIAGSREDLSEASFRSGRARLPRTDAPPVRLDALRGPESTGAADMLDRVAGLVREHSSIGELHIFPLLPDSAPFQVVRILAAHMEAVVDDGVVKLGSHAIRRLLALGGRR